MTSEMKADTLSRGNACIIPESSDILHVFSPRGRATINARNIRQIHETLYPHLPTIVCVSDFTAHFPDGDTNTVRRYLEALQRAGALTSVGKDNDDSSRLRSGIAQEDNSLQSSDARLAPHMDVELLPAHNLESTLFSYGRRTPLGCALVVVAGTSSGASAETIYRRYVDWLKYAYAQPGREAEFAVFLAEEAELGLRRVYGTATNRPWDLRGILDVLGMGSPEDCDQLPLIVVRGSPDADGQHAVYFGLRFDDRLVETILATEFQAHTRSHAAAEVCTGSAQSRGVSIGGDRDSVVALLIERHLELNRAGDIAKACDLLDENSGDRDIIYLQNVLRMRLRSLNAIYREYDNGLVAYEVAGDAWRSIVRQKALRDALLTVAFRNYYLAGSVDASNGLAADYSSYMSSGQLQSLVRCHLERAECNHCVPIITMRCESIFGLDVWIGDLT